MKENSSSMQLAKHLREVYFGGNWTSSNFKSQLADVTWQEANKRIYEINSIATLLYHTHYYVLALQRVLKNEALQAKDNLSFQHPPISSQQDWMHLLADVWVEVEKAAVLLENLPEDKLGEYFTDEKYGTYYRNILGIIEHLHYHLGQIALLKKIIRQES